MKNTNIRILTSLFLLILLMSAVSCKKFLLIEPPIDQLSPEVVFENNDAATSAVTGIYGRMMKGGAGGFASGDMTSVTAIAGMSADEYINYNPSSNDVAMNMLVSQSSSSGSIWSGAYQYIYTANAIIEGLSKSPGIAASLKVQLEAEAKFVRAFCYFYLVNLFGDVPLQLTTNYRVNSVAVRKPATIVYNQIIEDLRVAQRELPEIYSNDRIRPTKWAATALLARTYLYTSQWAKAEIESSRLISRQDVFKLETDFNKIFLKESKETIWQLKPVKAGYNTNEGNIFILTGAPSSISLSTSLIDAFEPGDRRRENWVGSVIANGNTYYYPFKYKVRSATSITEYNIVFRLAEQYLIRAEARIMQESPSGIEDLNLIRNRARPLSTAGNVPLMPDFASSISKATALSAVWHERRVELFAEWGHRWLDLKRSGHANEILKPVKGASWQETDIFYPIPQSERNANPAINQNNGY